VAITGVVVVTLWQLQPQLLLSSSTTTGGDTGAHVALPAFLRSTLLPSGQLTGWYPGWFNGFPLYTYYFVLPDLVAALASYVLGYGIAFKLATVLGSVLMPLCAYAMGRLFRLRNPIPAALAVAMLPFLFDSSFTIDGGNLFSTLAGEYAFSLSLALSFVVIGLFARGVQEGRGSVVTPLAMAACLASHMVPYLFAMVGAVLVTAVALLPRRMLRGDDAQGTAGGLLGDRLQPRAAALFWSARSAVLGIALSAWWLVPFALGQRYTNSMGYVNDTDYVAKLFPTADLWVLALAGLGIVLAIRQASRFGLVLSAQAAIWSIAFVVDPQGSLWNERLLPLWYISVYLLAGWSVGVVVAAIARAIRRRRLTGFLERSRRGSDELRPSPARWLPGAVGGALAILAGGLVLVLPPMIPQVVPASALGAVGIHAGANEVSAWATWNYSGYEGKPAWPEYKKLIDTMAHLGATDGCGRAMWEYSPSLNRFGTPMALMLLPYWTDNCIGSQEGLFFESSPTVPFHFLMQAELSQTPSEPQVGLPYTGVDVAQGVAHLQMLGVRYLMTSSTAVTSAADQQAGLTRLARLGPFPGEGSGVTSTTWSIYKVADAPVVAGLSHLPVVVPGIAASMKSWQAANVAWFSDPSRSEVPLAASGPASWPRGTSSTTTSPALPPVKVTSVRQSTSAVSFHVGRLGVPVVVKVSYYPRWHVTGAEGPDRISPNLMVVVPTSHDVTLSYGADPAVLVGVGISALSLCGLVAVWVLGRSRRRRPLSP
jgi:hypothetical protein